MKVIVAPNFVARCVSKASQLTHQYRRHMPKATVEDIQDLVVKDIRPANEDQRLAILRAVQTIMLAQQAA